MGGDLDGRLAGPRRRGGRRPVRRGLCAPLHPVPPTPPRTPSRSRLRHPGLRGRAADRRRALRLPGRPGRPRLCGVLGELPGPARHGDDAGRVCHGPVRRRRPDHRSPRSLASTGGPGPPGGRVHGGSVSAGFEQPDDPGRKRAGRRPTAPTAGGPAPPAATTSRASGASSPRCCARPPPPASRTRRPPAAPRPKPCATSTACSRCRIVTPGPATLPGRVRAARIAMPSRPHRAWLGFGRVRPGQPGKLGEA
jgi:hypothetical protein